MDPASEQGLPTDEGDGATVLADRIVITITDGGPYDDDGVVNGIIVDPGGAFRKLDKSPPTIECPATSYLLNQADAFAAATVTDDGSGPVTPTVTEAVDTTAIGTVEVTFSASDLAGNATTKPCEFPVGYHFDGFQSPLEADALNMVKAGSNVPVKWRITDANGVGISDAASFVGLSLLSASCPTATLTNSVAEGDIAVGTGLTYQGDGVWQYNWKSPKTARGCRDFRLLLADSVNPHIVQIQLR